MTGRQRKPRPRTGDTLAWLYASLQVLGPILLLLIAIIGAAYGLLHLLFLN